MPANATIRARGLATGGQYNRSSWLVETTAVVPQPVCRFTSVSHESNGRVRVHFFAPAGASCVVGASTNLVTWEVIGLAEEQADGTFVFEDTDAARFSYRYYRIQD